MRRQSEVFTGDMEVRQPPVIALDDNEIDRDDVIVADKSVVNGDYLNQLAFNEDVLTIMLSRSSEKFAPELIDIYVNGKVEWVPVGRPYMLKRKYVEVIARCQPFDVRTEVVREAENERNQVKRFQIAKHPFTVIHDPAGERGHAWLQQVMRES